MPKNKIKIDIKVRYNIFWEKKENESVANDELRTISRALYRGSNSWRSFGNPMISEGNKTPPKPTHK